MSHHFKSLIFAVLTFAFGTAHAAVLLQVKGDQVLIDLQGESTYTEGGRYFVMVGEKKKAIIEIKKIKGSKALGSVLKGTAQAQGTLAPLPAGSQASEQNSPKRQSHSSRSKRSKNGSAFSSLSYGVMAGYALTSQSVNTARNGVTETISMAGNSLSLKGFADLPISGPFGVIGRAGFENFGVSGNSVTLGSVSTSILYIDADLLLRYQFLSGNFHPFPLLGMGLHYPISKSSGVLDVQRISATTIFFIGGGVNYSLSNSFYIHATAEYGFFPPSNDVSTSLIAIRGGVGFTL